MSGRPFVKSKRDLKQHDDLLRTIARFHERVAAAIDGFDEQARVIHRHGARIVERALALSVPAVGDLETRALMKSISGGAQALAASVSGPRTIMSKADLAFYRRQIDAIHAAVTSKSRHGARVVADLRQLAKHYQRLKKYYPAGRRSRSKR